MIKDNRDFKDMVIEHFEHTTKTGWGKNEIIKMIKDLWISYLEETISNIEKTTPPDRKRKKAS